jgi:hypothetical protein
MTAPVHIPGTIETTLTASLVAPTVPGTTAWLPKLVALVPFAGAVVTYIDPGNKIPSGSLQAAVTLGLVVVALIIFTVDEILKNGLSKSGIEKTVSTEEAWFRANYADIRSTYEAVKPALDAIPGVPAAQVAVESEVSALKARFDALPPAQKVDVDQVAELAKTKILATLAGVPSVVASTPAPAPAVATATTPLPAPAAPVVPVAVV